MTRRDQGIVGALVAIFAVLAIAISLPQANRAAPPSGSAGASGSSTPRLLVGPSSDPSASSAPGDQLASAVPASGDASSDPGSSGASSSATPSASSGGAPADVIRQGIVGMPTSINPLTARSQADRDLVALVFSGLVRLGPKDTILPDLADRWTADRTGAHWTFHIRSTARWHDGDPVTADDVVFTVRLLRDPQYHGPFVGSWDEITVKKVDRLTVRFDMKTPLADFLQLARQPLLPAHLLASVPIQALTDSAFSAAPVGAGPYRLVQWDSSVAELQRASVAPDAQPTATAPGLELHFYPSTAALANAYRAGLLDMADGLPAATAKDLAGLPGSRIVRYPRATLTAVLFNLRTDHPTIRDQATRQALLMAIDRVTFVNDELAGFGNRADTLIPPASWAYVRSAAKAVPYDTSRAAKLLKADGWRKVNGKWHPPGSKNIFTLEIVTTTRAANPVAWAAAQYVARAWRAFGITVKVVALAPADLVSERLLKAKFTAAVVDMNIGLDPDLYPLLASRQARIGGSNLSGVQSLVLDDLLIAARRPGTLAQRRGAWAKLETFLSDAQVTLPLAFRDDALVVSDRVTGPRPHLQGDLSDRFWDVLTWRLAPEG